jgi:hypothetical protein
VCSSAPPGSKGLVIRPSIVTIRAIADRSQGAFAQIARRDRTRGQRHYGVPDGGRSAAGEEPGEDVLGALQVLSDGARRAHRIVLANRREQPRCWTFEELSTSAGGRCRRSGRSSRPAPRSSRRRACASVCFGQPDVQADVGLPVGGEVLERRAPASRATSSSASSVLRLGALAASTATPNSTARRESQTSCHCASISARAGPRAAAGRTTNVPPPRPRVANTCPLWVSASQRLAQRRARDAQARHSSRSAGSREPGASRPSLIAVAEPVDRLLEGGLASGPARRRVRG